MNFLRITQQLLQTEYIQATDSHIDKTIINLSLVCSSNTIDFEVKQSSCELVNIPSQI